MSQLAQGGYIMIKRERPRSASEAMSKRAKVFWNVWLVTGVDFFATEGMTSIMTSRECFVWLRCSEFVLCLIYRITGECLSCLNNTTGRECERCLDDHYGSALSDPSTCTLCQCSKEGTLRSYSPPQQSCSPTSGACVCKEFVVGQTCNSCAEGYYGFASGKG